MSSTRRKPIIKTDHQPQGIEEFTFSGRLFLFDPKYRRSYSDSSTTLTLRRLRVSPVSPAPGHGFIIHGITSPVTAPIIEKKAASTRVPFFNKEKTIHAQQPASSLTLQDFLNQRKQQILKNYTILARRHIDFASELYQEQEKKLDLLIYQRDLYSELLNNITQFKEILNEKSATLKKLKETFELANKDSVSVERFNQQLSFFNDRIAIIEIVLKESELQDHLARTGPLLRSINKSL